AERDPGQNAFIVVGLTSSLPLVSATFDELGCASVGGRHLIVRGYADLEERKLYADSFRDLRPEERELSLPALRRHKTAVVLLHEIAHTFDAEHDVVQGSIMNASYSHRARVFSPRSREVILQTIDRRLGRAPSAVALRETTSTPPPRASGQPGALIFNVTPAGKVELGGKLVDQIDVDNALEDTFARDRSTEVIIRVSQKAPAAAFEKIFDRATAIGFKVSITTY